MDPMDSNNVATQETQETQDIQNEQEAKTPVPTLEPDSVVLKVVSQDGNEVHFKLKSTTKMQKIMDAFCTKQGTTIAHTRFLYDGQRVMGDQTPTDLGMEDNDVIDAVVQQVCTLSLSYPLSIFCDLPPSHTHLYLGWRILNSFFGVKRGNKIKFDLSIKPETRVCRETLFQYHRDTKIFLWQSSSTSYFVMSP